MPSNTVLTPQVILREVYALMHQQSNFIMRTNRQYDERFARSGAKIGQTLDVRLPAKYTTREGNTMSAQNYVERKVQLPLVNIHGIDLNLGQEELTFSIDDISERVLKPAVAQLTATVESKAMSMLYKKVSNYVGLVTTASTTVFRDFQNGGRYITENLAPLSDRTAVLNPQTRVDFSDAVKGLYQSAENIRDQYVEGILGRTGGFDVFENTLLPSHTTGIFTSGSGLAATTSTAADEGFDGTGNAYPTGDGFELRITSGTSFSLKAGDIITLSGVQEVHPETKQPLGYNKRFVVQEDASGATTGTVKIWPYPILSGAYQNVSTKIANQAITLLGPSSAGNAITYGQNLLFHRDAFAFVTADLEDPSQYGAWGARQVMDGLSIRIWRQGDISNGNFPCRLDIAWGVAAIYPEWAVRWVHTLG
jgi:hypothetical protein